MPRHSRLSCRAYVALAAFLALGAVAPAVSQATTTQMVSTFSSWDGSSMFEAFGAGGTQTYGQVVTVPAGQSLLGSFTFYVELPTGVVFRPFVYAWNGSHATGTSLYEGPDMHTTKEGVYEPVTANTGGIPVTEGDQYVLFFSVSHDQATDEALTGTTFGSWGGEISHSVYGEGEYVYLNNEYEKAESEWTTATWRSYNQTEGYGAAPSSATAESTAFTAVFGPHPVISSVAPSTVSTGTSVTISGADFTGATEVLFGSTPATSFTVNSDSSITAVAPAGLSGTVDVRVIGPTGESNATSADEVTEPAPSKPELEPKPTPTPIPTPMPATPVIVITHVSGSVAHGTASVSLECTAAACEGKLSLAWVHKLGNKTVTTLFSRGQYKLAAGESKAFTAVLSSEALKRLKQSQHGLEVRARATVTGGVTAHDFALLKLQ